MFYDKITKVSQEEMMEEYLEKSRYSKIVSDSRFEDCNVRIINFDYDLHDTDDITNVTLCDGKCLSIKYNKGSQKIWNGN